MSRDVLGCVLGAVVALLGCAPGAPLPEGSVEVRIETDALLPSASASTTPIFDGVRLEVLTSDGTPACDSCVREVGLSRELCDEGATFVVQSDGDVVLRARLFSSPLAQFALEPGAVVERWVRLPARPAAGTTRVVVALPMESVGQPLGSLASPTEADDAGTRLPPLVVETSTAMPTAGEVCLDGGWFWLGDPRLPPSTIDTTRPRLVRLSPFCVDRTEVSVAALRQTGVDVTMVARWSGATAPSEPAAFCTYTDAPGPNDDRAVNCVPPAVARAACQSRGADLPTEAQLEYLGSALGRSSFVWGHDLPSCDEAVFGHAIGVVSGDWSCVAGSTTAFLPVRAVDLDATRDVLVVGEDRIVGLAGNVAELTREAYAPPDSDCRGPSVGVLRDPECPLTPAAAKVAVRGGGWASAPAQTAAALREYMGATHIRFDVGFRCVRQ